jgi:WD40 repeat protein
MTPEPAFCQLTGLQSVGNTGDNTAHLDIHVLRKLPVTGPFNIIWSKDGSRIAAFSDAGTLVTVWDRDGRVINELHRPGPFFVNPEGLGFVDGNRQVVMPPASYKRPDVMLSIYDVASGEVVRELPGPRPGQKLGNMALVIAASPDQSLIAAVTGGPPHGIESVHLYAAPNWDLAAVLTESAIEPRTPAINFVFSADSKLLAIGRGGGSAIIYDVTSRTPLRTISAFTKYLTPVTCIAISPDDQFVVVGTGMASAGWHFPDGSLAPPGQGQMMVTRAPDPVRVYRISDGALVASETGFLEPIYEIAWSPRGHLIAYIAGDATLHFWNPAHPTDPDKTVQLGRYATSLAFSPDGGQLAASDRYDLTILQLDEVP